MRGRSHTSISREYGIMHSMDIDIKKTFVCGRMLAMTMAAFATVSAMAAAPAAVQCAGDVTCERFPDADSVLLDETERVAYNPDGTYDLTDEYWLKILTEKGRRSESSISLRYSRRYGEAEIVLVEAGPQDRLHGSRAQDRRRRPRQDPPPHD